MSIASKTSDNHAKAPECAKIVTDFRTVFGAIDVEYVKENGVLKGEPGKPGASCTLASDGRDLQEAYPPK